MLSSAQGSFTGVGAGAALPISLPAIDAFTGKVLANGSAINVSVGGSFVGTVQLERQFEVTNPTGDKTWYPVARDPTGTLASFTSPTSLSVTETEGDVAYRLRCTAYTSGPIVWRISE